jgi:trimeric autotransporter adhesin
MRFFKSVPRFEGAERGGFMRRFLTFVCLLGVALPAGISISGCVRNPAGKYCNGLGYGLTLTEVANLTLQPQIAGISLAYGQTTAILQPVATTCKGDPAAISGGSLSYGTTNNQLVDISPAGGICAGTWNRNSGGGIPDYTFCNNPNPLPSTGGLPYAIAYITATADSVTSNPVAVYIHAPISSISLVTNSVPSTGPQQCFSQNTNAQLDAQACYVSNGSQYELCAPPSVSPANYACAGGLAPGVTSVPECTSSIGTLSFASGNSAVASINSTTNVITAEQPGTTVITASIAETASSAGYFSTCPPKSISISLANGNTKGVVTQGVVQNLQTMVTDTLGKSITGLTLDYESTNPVDITTSGSGSITPAFPGVATLTALCKPPLCNPAPINEIGLNGTGLSITSNPVDVIVPGKTSDFVWFGAPGQSQYFYSAELLTGTPGSTVRLPFVPNSMVMDQAGLNLYFGSPRELMIYSTSNNSLTKQDTTVPGVVLAVSPNANTLLINDQVRGLFYLYNVSGGITSTFGGLGVAATWTQDSNTLYVVDSAALGGNHTNTLYVHDANSGWSTYDLSASGGAQNLVLTVPGLGAYLAGDPTVAHTWCPSGTVGDNATIQFYPQSDSVNLLTNALGATSDGEHILSGSLSGTSITLNDIGVNIPPTSAFPAAECPVTLAGATQTLSPLSTNPVLNGSVNLSGVTDATAINQIVTGTAPTTASVTTAAPIAFVTYNTPGTSTTAAPLPYYLPQSTPGSVGPVGYVTFADSTSAAPPTAPLDGAFSPDHSIFFVSTAGDDEVHFINIPATLSPTSAPADTQQLTPALPACTPVSAGGNDAGCLYPTAPGPTTVVPVTVIAVKPRAVT